MDHRMWSLKFEEALILIDARYEGTIDWSTAVFFYTQTGCPLKTAAAYAKMVKL